METIIKYLLESSVILGVLAVFYRLVLHNEPMFRFNRMYLLLSLLVAAVVPLLDLSSYFFTKNSGPNITYMLGAVNVYSGQVQQTIVPVITKHHFFNWLYVVGASVLLARLFYGFFRLGGLSQKAEWQKINGYKVANLPGRFNPFSFFRVIFVNSSLYSKDDLAKIMEHEMAHVRFNHSLDVIIIEALLVIQWFNPFAWIIRRLLKELHEFQADQEVLKKGASIGQYKMLLLFQASGARLLPVNNFNQSITKKRFKMMTNNSLRNSGVMKAVAGLFVVATVTFFFACDNIGTEEIQQQADEISNEELMATKVEGYFLPDSSTVYFMVDEMPQFPGGDMELRKYIAQSVKYPVIAREQGVQGRVYVQFVVDTDGKVADVKTVRGVDVNLDEEAIRVIAGMPKWIPGKHEGEPVRVSYTVPINFVLQGEGSGKDIISEEPMVLKDGVEISKADMNKLDPEIIESVSVLKDKALAVEKYGEKAKNGVIIIETKEANSEKNAVHVVGYK
ncbi:M56 family metallopeptidase [Plebeiibacterium marinum]|uniref:TonB family protein n=1 Tax=Plebeiibacterium marinum TaxID=2992111 RepID=A0AAE3MGS8_9BACT|nr:M56 family metallopeptidase [Plebeiobacterium marinum]MCW3807299.1 TonB family protein [Plebeiobacterium marinum]